MGHKEAVGFLITKGAGVSIKNNAGRTSLDIASRQKRRDIVDLLRKHGAKE